MMRVALIGLACHVRKGSFLLRRLFLGVSPLGLLSCARDQQLPAPITFVFETSMLDVGNVIVATVRVWDVHFHKQNKNMFCAHIHSNLTCSHTIVCR